MGGLSTAPLHGGLRNLTGHEIQRYISDVSMYFVRKYLQEYLLKVSIGDLPVFVNQINGYYQHNSIINHHVGFVHMKFMKLVIPSRVIS